MLSLAATRLLVRIATSLHLLGALAASQGCVLGAVTQGNPTYRVGRAHFVPDGL